MQGSNLLPRSSSERRRGLKRGGIWRKSARVQWQAPSGQVGTFLSVSQNQSSDGTLRNGCSQWEQSERDNPNAALIYVKSPTWAFLLQVRSGQPLYGLLTSSNPNAWPKKGPTLPNGVGLTQRCTPCRGWVIQENNSKWDGRPSRERPRASHVAFSASPIVHIWFARSSEHLTFLCHIVWKTCITSIVLRLRYLIQELHFKRGLADKENMFGWISEARNDENRFRRMH